MRAYEGQSVSPWLLMSIVDVVMQGGATALLMASWHGHAEVVGALLASGAAVNQGTSVSIGARVLQTME